MERKRRDEDLEREIRGHIEEEADELRSHGALDEEARLSARRSFGNATAVAELCRERRNWAGSERLIADLRSGLRNLRRNPAWTAVAIATLALGIGANTAIFSVVSAVLLRPLEYRDPERLVTLLGNNSNPVSRPDFLDWKKDARSFESMAAASAWSANIIAGEHPEQVMGLQLTEGMFAMLGVPPLLGRTFTAEEHETGKEFAAVLSHRLWQRRFGSDPSIIGQSIEINGSSYQITGVMPANFRFAPFWVTNAEIWTPLASRDGETNRIARFLRVFARLKPGVRIETAQAEMDTICRRLEIAYAATNTKVFAEVEPLIEKVVGRVRESLLALMAAVGFVLLIACTNLANLAMAQTAGRRREIAIRTALGAGRWRVVRQLVTESMVMALAGGVLGAALAWWSVEEMKSLLVLGRVPRAPELRVDQLAFLFTAAMSLLTGLLFGLLPALEITRGDLHGSLKEGSRGSEGGRGFRTRGTLVVCELAMSMVLLVAAGLVMRSFWNLRSLDPGFNPQNLLTMSVSVTGQPEYTGARRVAFYSQALDRLRALPGVQAASFANHPPIGGDTWGFHVYAAGRLLPAPGEEVGTVYRVAHPEYFRTLGIRLLQGRDFTLSDHAASERVVIINQTLARFFWPAGNAIGKRISVDARNKDGWMTVVGVVNDVKQGSWTREPRNELYIPFLQTAEMINGTGGARSYVTFAIRTAVPPESLVNPARQAVWALNKSAGIRDARSMEEVVAGAIGETRFYVLLLSIFAGVALLLAAIGIYGVMAFAVSRRTQEIGIRVALGARRSQVIWMVLVQGMRFVLAGVVLGAAAAFVAARGLQTMLFGVTPSDPMTFAVIPLVLLIAAAVACFLPARRASSVDPLIALRSD